MKPTFSLAVFVLTEVLATAYLLLTTNQLPGTIASHFNGAGAANGFMTHQGYLIFMLVFLIGVPVVTVTSISIVMSRSPDKINIPNKAYWLSPERLESTMSMMKSHMLWLGTGLAAFMAYMHWLLLQANAVSPPTLPEEQFLVGVMAFVVATFVWGFWLVASFLRVPPRR